MIEWWWEKDPRYGSKDWTLITDGQGTRFVRVQRRKKRRPARVLRFPDLKPGDVMLHRGKSVSVRYEEPLRLAGLPPIANDDAREVVTTRHWVGLALCTDRWFDPVQGQDDPIKGDMVGLRWITGNGLTGTKLGYPIRALATQGYWPTTPDQAERVRAFIDERAQLVDAWQSGTLTAEEVRLRATPWSVLMRDLDVEPATGS